MRDTIGRYLLLALALMGLVSTLVSFTLKVAALILIAQ
mgnify:FL=1